MRIEIICTGDEVISGKIVNTNFQYITQTLADHGFTVRWESTVGDQREDLLEAFRLAGLRSDIVIVNGGLGPTVDDLSQEVAAMVAGVELVLHESWVQRMQEMFKRFGREMPDNNIKQAMLPDGAELIDNPVGTACGFAMTINQARFYFTPGVPNELFRMLPEQIIPDLIERTGEQKVMVQKRFHAFGLGESHTDRMLSGLLDDVSVRTIKLGFQAHFPQLEIKLNAEGENREVINQQLEPLIAEVRARLGDYIIAEDDQTLEGNIVQMLSEQGATLSVCEQFSGGQLAARIATETAARDVFQRGLVFVDLLQLAKNWSLDINKIDEQALNKMANSVCERYGSTHALVLGVNFKETIDKMQQGGDVLVAVATPNATHFSSRWIVGNHHWVRLGAVETGLDVLRRVLQGKSLQY